TTATPLQGRYGDEGPEAVLLKTESVAQLLRALSELSPREQALVRGRYFEGRSLDAVAQELGLSKSWASRLHSIALRKLRAVLEAT
ncbi:MAG: sigma-70 family RNA polymerase sigma factor, partial [Myxococcales bacterium]